MAGSNRCWGRAFKLSLVNQEYSVQYLVVWFLVFSCFSVSSIYAKDQSTLRRLKWLGSTVAVKGDESYSMTSMTAFGESSDSNAFFTGKPFIGELGYAFLMRSYRPENGKWQTADPIGYPDGWNNLAYCNNGVTSCVDLWGCDEVVAVAGADYITETVRYEHTDISRFLNYGYQDGVYGSFWENTNITWEITEYWKNTPYYDSTWATVLDASSTVIAGSLGAAVALYEIPHPVTWAGATVGVLIGGGTGLVTWFVCRWVAPDPTSITIVLMDSGDYKPTKYVFTSQITVDFHPIIE